MSIFSLVGKVAKFVGGALTKSSPPPVSSFVAAPPVALGRMGAPAGFGGTLAPKRRRRRRKRLSDSEISELILLKSILGARSPLLTIFGIKIIGRGG